MATFVSIPDTDLDANSPITENLMLALRDNPLAIAQGDITAPKISTEALSPLPTGSLEDYTAGSWNEITNPNDTGETILATTPTLYTAGRLLIGRSGTVTSVFTLAARQGLIAGTLYGRIYVNAVAVGTTRSITGEGPATFTENIAVNAGDELRVYTWRTNTADYYGRLYGFHIHVSNPTNTGWL